MTEVSLVSPASDSSVASGTVVRNENWLQVTCLSFKQDNSVFVGFGIGDLKSELEIQVTRYKIETTRTYCVAQNYIQHLNYIQQQNYIQHSIMITYSGIQPEKNLNHFAVYIRLTQYHKLSIVQFKKSNVGIELYI